MLEIEFCSRFSPKSLNAFNPATTAKAPRNIDSKNVDCEETKLSSSEKLTAFGKRYGNSIDCVAIVID